MIARTDPRFDAYLKDAPEFARPILEHVRGLVQEVCPTAQETLKWRMAAFVHRGKILCIVGAFKTHCVLHFWNSELVIQAVRERGKGGEDKLLSRRLTGVADLPDDETLRFCIEVGMGQIESGEPSPVRAAPGKRREELPVPADFTKMLKKVPTAQKTLAKLPPSCRREYLVWIAGAKREETRVRRMATAVEWLAEGKRYDWRHQKA